MDATNQWCKYTDMDAIADFSCNQCGKHFDEEVFLFLHQYKNHDKTPFKCKECGESGVGQQKLYYHMKSHRELKLKIYRCHLCPFENPRLDVFQKHAQLHAFEREKAQKEAESQDFLGQNEHNEHNQPHEQEPLGQIDHENAMHAKDFTVDEDFNSQNLNMSNTGIAVRNEQKPNFKANFVKATRQRKNALEDFFESSDSPTLKSEQAQCEVCNNSMSKSSLSRHMKTVHGGRGKKWECSDCGKCLQSKLRLKQHMRKHFVADDQVEGSFPCTICKYNTSNKYYLSNHLRVNHREEEGVWVCHMGKCSENPKSFINSRILSKHQGNHVNIPCLECGKVFGAKRGMIRHMRATHKEACGQKINDS